MKNRILCLLMLLGIATMGITACSKKSATEQAREKADPKVVRYLIAAEEAYKMGAYNAALVLADSAKAREPQLADIHYLYGLIYNETRRFEDAKKAFQEVVAFDPNYKGVWLQLGHTAYRKEDMREALRFYRRENGKHPAAAVWYSIGRCYEKLGIDDSARIAYEQALSLDDKYSLAYLRLGHIHQKAGDLEKALHYSKAGLALEPDNLDYQFSVGSLLLLKGEAEAASPYFQRVVEERPWHYWANQNLGQALARMNRKTEAEHYIAVAESLFITVKEIDHWRNLAQSNPDQLELWLNLGEALRKTNQIDEAIEAYKMAIFLGPNHLELHNDLANLFLMHGDTVNAQRLYQDILAKDSTMPDVWLNLGVLHANAGRAGDARTAWQKVLQLDPKHETARKYLEELGK